MHRQLQTLSLSLSQWEKIPQDQEKSTKEIKTLREHTYQVNSNKLVSESVTNSESAFTQGKSKEKNHPITSCCSSCDDKHNLKRKKN